MYFLKWHPAAWEEYCSIQKDKVLLKRMNTLLKDIQRNGFQSTFGKIEMLKHDFSGCASVRIDQKNRIIFTIEGDSVVILQCAGHYQDK